MSTGAFKRGKYQRDDGVIHPIRIQPETVTSWNTEPSGEITGKGTFRATPSRRSSGLFARYVGLSKTVGSNDGPYTGATINITVPVLEKEAFDELELYESVEYQGSNWTVTSKQGERIK